MSQACAYCGNIAPLTREHVVPSFIYKRNPLGKFGYNPKADAFITYEAQIKDVCAECNNRHLSALDGYLKYFCDDNDLDRLVTDEKSVRVRYDFSLLCRALLKLSFNCQRFRGSSTGWLRPFSDYILYGVDSPGSIGVKLAVEVLPCHKITEQERQRFEGEAKTWEYLPPHAIRLGQIGGQVSECLFIRYVFLKNFCFFLVMFSRTTEHRLLRRAFDQFSSALPEAVFLNFEKKAVTIKVSKATAVDRYADTGALLADKWRTYVAKKG